jgi:hypothetical protein
MKRKISTGYGVMKLPCFGDSGHKRTQLFLYPLLPEAHLDHHLVLDRYVRHNLKAAQKAQDLQFQKRKFLNSMACLTQNADMQQAKVLKLIL